MERNHGEPTRLQGLPVRQARKFVHNGDALADEVRCDKRRYWPPSGTDHWICWRQDPNEGTHTNPAPPAQDVGMGQGNGLLGRTGHVQVLRRRPFPRRHVVERGGGRRRGKGGSTRPQATLNPFVAFGSNQARR